MKIAIPTAGGRLAAHFGHCQEFMIFELKDNKVINKEILTPPPHEPGVLPNWLFDLGVNLVLAGGMGQRAVMLFNEKNIKVITGVPSEEVEEIINSYLQNSLVLGENVCGHDENSPCKH